MTKTAKYEDLWEFLDPDTVMETKKLPIFLRFLESQSTKSLEVGECDGLNMTLIAIAKDNKMVLHRTSAFGLGILDKKRIIEALDDIEGNMGSANRQIIKRILMAYMDISPQQI